MRGLTKFNKKAVGKDRIPSEIYKFASERLSTMISIFISGCMLTGKLPSTLLHVVIIPLLKCRSKDPANVNNYRQIEIVTALSKVLEQDLLSRLARSCGLQTANLVSSMKMGQKWPHLHSNNQWIFTVIRTHQYTRAPFLMQKSHLNELIIGHW